MFDLIRKLLRGGRPSAGPLTGIKLKPFEDDPSEPYRTFSLALAKELRKNGVEFAPDAAWKCELDWVKLGGSQLRIKAAAAFGPITIHTTVREGMPLHEVVDFDIERVIFMNENRKLRMFFVRAAEKLVEQLTVKYRNYQQGFQ